MPLGKPQPNYQDRTPQSSTNKPMRRQMKKVKMLRLKWLIVSQSQLSRQKDQVKDKKPFKWTHLRRTLTSDFIRSRKQTHLFFVC